MFDILHQPSSKIFNSLSEFQKQVTTTWKQASVRILQLKKAELLFSPINDLFVFCHKKSYVSESTHFEENDIFRLNFAKSGRSL